MSSRDRGFSKRKAVRRNRPVGRWSGLSALIPRKKREAKESQVDPRIAARAQKVRETEERKAFKRALLLLLVLSLAGVGAWAAYSPYLALHRLVVTGVAASSVHSHIEEAGITQGVPMISIDAQSLHQVLLTDPWVRAVEVEKRWPHTVSVTVQERSPVAWVLAATGWHALSPDGTALDVDPQREMPHVTGLAGTVTDLSHPSLRPALGFLEHLRSDLLAETVVEIHGEQVTATVARRVVRLGRANDLEEKAGVLGVLIDNHADPGTVINLFSPHRPAVYRGPPEENLNILPSS